MNKLYLKVGVALTAAFAFGYFVGTELAIRKMREMMAEKSDDFELVKNELIYQVAQQEPEEPKEEDKDMARRKPAPKRTVTESFHMDIPYELVVDEFGITMSPSEETWAKCTNTAAERVSKALNLFVEQEDEQMMEAFGEIQRRNIPMHIRDTTIYPFNDAMRKMRFIYVRNSNRLYWRIGDWRDRIEHKEICDILARLMTFSVTRENEEGEARPTTWTPILLMSEEGILPDDDPELYNTRIFTLEDLGIEVEIIIEPTEPYPGRIDALLEAHVEDE